MDDKEGHLRELSDASRYREFFAAREQGWVFNWDVLWRAMLSAHLMPDDGTLRAFLSNQVNPNPDVGGERIIRYADRKLVERIKIDPNAGPYYELYVVSNNFRRITRVAPKRPNASAIAEQLFEVSVNISQLAEVLKDAKPLAEFTTDELMAELARRIKK